MLESAYSYHVGEVEATGLAKMNDSGALASWKVVMGRLNTQGLIEFAGWAKEAGLAGSTCWKR